MSIALAETLASKMHDSKARCQPAYNEMEAKTKKLLQKERAKVKSFTQKCTGTELAILLSLQDRHFVSHDGNARKFFILRLLSQLIHEWRDDNANKSLTCRGLSERNCRLPDLQSAYHDNSGSEMLKAFIRSHHDGLQSTTSVLGFCHFLHNKMTSSHTAPPRFNQG